jgi:hypothetical protein
MWSEGSIIPSRNISSGLEWPRGLFVSSKGDIYVDNGAFHGRVDMWTSNATSSVTVMYVSASCYGLFVDINDTLYCSMCNHYKVIKASLSSGPNISTLVAGNGTAGSSANTLHDPHRIFVDIEFNLYVADAGNNRIQFYQSGQSNGTTVAGNEANGTITLLYPEGIILDADGYLFIADSNNGRIVGSGPNGIRCIVGCTGVNGSAYNQLSWTWSLSFDSYGSLFVNDQSNARIQKFFLATNPCGKCL